MLAYRCQRWAFALQLFYLRQRLRCTYFACDSACAAKLSLSACAASIWAITSAIQIRVKMIVFKSTEIKLWKSIDKPRRAELLSSIACKTSIEFTTRVFFCCNFSLTYLPIFLIFQLSISKNGIVK